MHSSVNEYEIIESYIINYLRNGYYNRKINYKLNNFQIWNYVDLTSETRLLHDLGIFGDEAEEVLEDMHKKYPFEYSEFVFDDYFPSEFSNNFSGIFSIFNHIVPTRVKLVKNFYKPMTIAYLAKSLQSGVLK